MKINGNEYKIPELNFNTMCMLEDMGLNFMNMDNRMLLMVRGLLALAMKTDIETAGKEFEAHIINGGTLDEITQEINEAVQTSGFFQALQQSQAKGNTAGKNKTAAKSKAE